MKSTVLELKNVYKNFGRKKLLQDISFTLKEGEVLCFIGKNGVGKTTLFDIILKNKSRNFGEIAFFDKKEKNVGYLFQQRNFGESLTVDQMLKVVKYSLKKDPKKLEFYNYLFDTLELNKNRITKISFLSGGEQQKMSIFQTVINTPKVLFLDEYSNNLDEVSLQKVKEIFKKLVTDFGTSVLLVSHKVEEISGFADRIYVLKDKKIQSEINIKDYTDDQILKLLEEI